MAGEAGARVVGVQTSSRGLRPCGPAHPGRLLGGRMDGLLRRLPRHLLRTRLLSFGLILGVAFLLMVSLVIGAGVAAFGRWWGAYFTGWEIAVQAINFVVGFAIIGWFLKFVTTRGYGLFVWYRILLGLALYVLLGLGVISA